MGRHKSDLTGRRFGRLVVIKDAGSIVYCGTTQRLLGCKCDCGKTITVRRPNLVGSRTQSCGCLRRELIRCRPHRCGPRKHLDLTGQRFDKLLVIENAGKRGSSYIWKCQCDCGRTTRTSTTALKQGYTHSCGCLRRGPRLPQGKAGFNRLFTHYRCGAKKRGYEFCLTPDQFGILTQQNCYHCGSPPRQEVILSDNRKLVESINWGQYIYNGIDRVDNDKGYLIDNCVPCCEQCNKAKRTLTQQEFYNWIKQVYKHSFGGRR